MIPLFWPVNIFHRFQDAIYNFNRSMWLFWKQIVNKCIECNNTNMRICLFRCIRLSRNKSFTLAIMLMRGINNRTEIVYTLSNGFMSDPSNIVCNWWCRFSNQHQFQVVTFHLISFKVMFFFLFIVIISFVLVSYQCLR